MKTLKPYASAGPVEVIRRGSIQVLIYSTTNRIYRVNPESGQREFKSAHPHFTVAYYDGSKRVKWKFARLDLARKEAALAAEKLAQGESQVLRLSGYDRLDYVRAMQRLHAWKPSADLNHAVSDYVDAVRRLPDSTSLKEAVDFFLKRNPIGLPVKSVRAVLDELIASKRAAGKGEKYLADLEQRVGRFTDVFKLGIGSISGREIEEFIRGLGLAGRTQNNYRQMINTLFRYGIKRGYPI